MTDHPENKKETHTGLNDTLNQVELIDMSWL